ncbi:hypothetical protein, partial [Micrococcus luteus]
CSTRSWPEGSPGFFSSIMVMILTVPLGTAYTDHLTRPKGNDQLGWEFMGKDDALESTKLM